MDTPERSKVVTPISKFEVISLCLFLVVFECFVRWFSLVCWGFCWNGWGCVVFFFLLF